MTGEESIAAVRARTPDLLLAFSCGKDSIGAWLALRPHFDRIIPFYCYLVPSLEFVERSLVYYEEFFATPILRVPHPSLYRMLNNLVFQSPQHCAVIEDLSLANFSYIDLHRAIREDYAVPDAWVAAGVRAADSPYRRLAMNKYGPLRERTKEFFPIHDWNKARLVAELQAARIKLPADYRIFGRSFDGLDYRFLAPIREHYPRDYARILEFFPLADVELKRRQYAQQ